MKKWACMLLAAAGAMVGCQQEQKPVATRASVLDVGPAQGYPTEGGYVSHGTYPVASTTPVAPSNYQLPSITPPAQPAPAVVETQTPAIPAASSTPANRGAGQRYTVKQGDTLYHIAKVQYGDGKQWQRIASANPGIAPSTLKVGQVLALP